MTNENKPKKNKLDSKKVVVGVLCFAGGYVISVIVQALL